MTHSRPDAERSDREACWARALELDAASVAGEELLEQLLAEKWSPPVAINTIMRLHRRDGVVPPPAPWHHDP